MRYYLGLGGNLGDREDCLRQCRERLERSKIRIRRESSLYETEPVGRLSQPWYLNQAIEVETDLGPSELLEAVKSIESDMGRILGNVGGPRLIDIDILLAGALIVDTGRLQLPHPRMASRNFVLVPLSEISAGAVHPVLGKTIGELQAECRDTSAYCLY
ncbi:MAG: 2-amino-4-hydroxy-6-hydroxymethyldihydropteridine diphosphokinase [Candidatus Aminicenantaceae bacterium]